MATITSAASGNASAGATWVGGVAPGPADDVIIAGHTITLDVDRSYNSLTISNTASRLALPAGANRLLTLTNGFTLGAAISATLLTIVSGQTLTVEVGTGFRYNSNQTNATFTVSTGALVLRGVGGSPDSELLDPLTAAAARLFATSNLAASVTTIGRLSVGAGTHQVITIAGGTWTHQHDGVTQFNTTTSTAKLLSVSGSNLTTINFTGDIASITPATTTGLLVLGGSACTATFNSYLYSSVANNGGSILYCSAGTTILNGKISHMAGTNSLSLWLAGGTFRWENQSVMIDGAESFTMICSAGFFDIDGLLVDNKNKFIGTIYGTGNGSATGCVITCASGAVAGFNFIDPTYQYLPPGAPTLPDPGDVAAGIQYGYSTAELLGTALVLNPSVLASALSLATVSANLIQVAGDAASANALRSMLDGTGGAQLTLRNLLIDASGTIGTTGIEVKTNDRYPLVLWDTAYHASLHNGFRVSTEENGVLFPTDGYLQADLSGAVNTVAGNVNGKVLGGGSGVITSTGVRAELGSNAIGATQIANSALTAAKFSGVFPSNFAALIINASGHITRVTTTDVASNMITASTIRSALGVGSPNLDTQLGTLAANLTAVLEDTGTTLPAQIAALETGGATAADVWNYFVAATGDAAATRIGVAVADQSIFTPFQVAVGSVGPDAIQAYAINDNAVEKIAAGIWDLLLAGHMDAGSAGEFLARLDATLSSRLSGQDYQASLPDNFADLSITADDGLVTATGSGIGLYAIYIEILDQDQQSVKSARLWLAGSSESVYTDAFGRARLYADPGSYELRCSVPFGYQPLTPQTIMLVDQDLEVDLVAQRTTSSVLAPAGMCAITLRVIDQTGQPVAGAVVTHRIAPGYAVIDDEWLINAAPANITSEAGIVELIAARLQVYDYTVTLAEHHRVTIRRRTPDLATATLSTMIEV